MGQAGLAKPEVMPGPGIPGPGDAGRAGPETRAGQRGQVAAELDPDVAELVIRVVLEDAPVDDLSRNAITLRPG
jgi:hypothetical protein